MKNEGLLSKRVIEIILENYHDYFTSHYGPKTAKYGDYNSGGMPRSNDGITYGRLNKVILRQAIDTLEPNLKAVIYFRWVYQHTPTQTVQQLGISRKQYYSLCRKAVDAIYQKVNETAVDKPDVNTA